MLRRLAISGCYVITMIVHAFSRMRSVDFMLDCLFHLIDYSCVVIVLPIKILEKNLNFCDCRVTLISFYLARTPIGITVFGNLFTHHAPQM